MGANTANYVKGVASERLGDTPVSEARIASKASASFAAASVAAVSPSAAAAVAAASARPQRSRRAMRYLAMVYVVILGRAQAVLGNERYGFGRRRASCARQSEAGGGSVSRRT